MIGRFSRQKDQLSLLDALKLLPSARLDLVGDGYFLDKCIDYVHNHSLENKVNFVGRLHNESARLYFSRWDIYLLISRWEGLPVLSSKPCLLVYQSLFLT